MSAVFLMTSTLRFWIIAPESSPLRVYLESLKKGEIWISPLSYAIIEDDNLRSRGSGDQKINMLNAIHWHRKKYDVVEARRPLPNEEVISMWTKIRGTKVNLPAFTDTTWTHPKQRIGPDELLVFCTAAIYEKPLLGPPPMVSAKGYNLLSAVGIRFEWGPLLELK